MEPLKINAAILNNKNTIKAPLDKANDTLNLPFIDDFSSVSKSIFANQSLWTDSGAYINNHFPINPITVGVATFDGLNKDGKPYSYNPTDQDNADYLTSKPIDLGIYTLDDSLYLSFYFQAGGLGNMPEHEDEFSLEFKAPNMLFWEEVWKTSTPLLTPEISLPFSQVLLPIKDAKFLKRGFQFRFTNKATLSGNLDHWHLDYVYLNQNRNLNDKLRIDIAPVKVPISFIKPYTSMPWDHFLINPSAYTINNWETTIRNLNNTTPATNYQTKIINNVGTASTLFNGSDNAVSQGILTFNPSGINPTFTPSNTIANQENFTIQHIVAVNQDVLKQNDTVLISQKFETYYAYDDGSAELGLFLQNLGSVNTGMFAYQFDIAKTDTLQAVDVFFTYIQNSAASNNFTLTIWQNNNGNPGDTLLTQANLLPVYENGISTFHRYELGRKLLLNAGTYFIGWKQNSQYKINIGFDRNTDATNKMKYNVTGAWQNYNNIAGSLMMRPIVGNQSVLVTTKDIKKEDFSLKIYPVPASDVLNITTDLDIESIEIMNLTGNIIKKIVHSNTIEVSDLSAGIYLLNLNTSAGFIRKLITIVD